VALDAFAITRFANTTTDAIASHPSLQGVH
jgi:hypothetical protein